MKTLILCGGKGTRAYPHTAEVPKPLLEVAGRPVLLHLMELFAAQGFTSFVLAAGFKRRLLEEFATSVARRWDVEVLDTGEDTGTGERVRLARDGLGERFFATYADGLGDVDLEALLAFHESHGHTATLTSVPLRSQYGTIESDGDGRVHRFLEKPVLADHWINAGFFVFDEHVFDHWQGQDLERDVLPALSAARLLFAYRHDGFWRSLDTYKDAVELTRLCEKGRAPWTRSGASASS